MIEARYDLAFDICGHDFYSWLAVAKARGAERIVFGVQNPKTTKWNQLHVLERFESIIEPGPALAELPYRFGNGGFWKFASPHMMDLVPFCQRNKISRLKSPLRKFTGIKYTVTIRNEPRIKDMNSNQEAWRRFADEIGATVIEDQYDELIHLHERMAIYADAEMNFGVVNGPMHLLSLTEYPVTIFKANVSRPNLEKHLVPFGTTPPWFLENQKLLWIDDSYDNLIRNFEASGLER